MNQTQREVSCWVCGYLHDADDDECPRCGAIGAEPSEDQLDLLHEAWYLSCTNPDSDFRLEEVDE